MLKNFLKDGFIYTISNIISRLIGFILLPLYTSYLSPDDYGLVDLIGIFATFINLTIALEISQGLGRYYLDSKNEDERILYASTAFWFTLIVYVVFFLISFTLSYPINLFLTGIPSFEYSFKVALIMIFFSNMFYLLLNQLRFDSQAKKLSTINILGSFVSIFFNIIFILKFKLGINGLFYGNIVGSALSCFLALYFLRDKYKFLFSKELCEKMIKFGAPLVPSSISVFVATYIDRLAINNLMSIKDLGIYGIAYKFASITSILLGGFIMTVTPLIYQNYMNKDSNKEVLKLFNLYLFFSSTIILFLSLFSLEIVYFMTTTEFHPAYKVIPLISIFGVLSQLYVFAPGLGIAKKTKEVSIINIICALTNTCLNFILIPYYGIVGSSLATVISYFLMIFLYIKEGQKFYFINYNWSKIFITVILIILNLILSFYIEQVSLNLFIFKFFIFILSLISILFLLLEYSIVKEKFSLFVMKRS